jgi:phage-related protein
MAAGDWSLVFYADGRGGEPVRDFLQSLDLRTQARFDWSLEQLRLRNIMAREPLVKHLEGPIWELRRESATNIFRLLYATLPNRRILFLHGFQKKTQKTPRREIAVAQQRLTEFLSREGGEIR